MTAYQIAQGKINLDYLIHAQVRHTCLRFPPSVPDCEGAPITRGKSSVAVRNGVFLYRTRSRVLRDRARVHIRLQYFTR